MKILAINGSHRGAKGCTQWLLDKLAQGVREAGGEFATVVLAERKITPCAGCETCHTSEHYPHCIYEHDDDFSAIVAAMRDADILIFATPVYIFNITGRMKTFLDRLNGTIGTNNLCVTQSGLFFGHVDKQLHSKPFVLLTCCGNVEHETVKNVVAYFRTFARFLDAPIVGELVRKSIGMLGADQPPDGEPPQPVVAAVVSAYIQAGRELATAGRISAGTQRRANQHILGIPCLDLLMHFRMFKKMALKKSLKP